MEKQKLLYEQNRLANRGAAETVLLYISASKGRSTLRSFSMCRSSVIAGQNNEMLQQTLQLGISLLHGGNRDVQKVIIDTSDASVRLVVLAHAGLPEGN